MICNEWINACKATLNFGYMNGHSSHLPRLNYGCKIECLQNAPHWQSLQSECQCKTKTLIKRILYLDLKVTKRLFYLGLNLGWLRSFSISIWLWRWPRGFSILIWMKGNQEASLSWFELGQIERLLYLNLNLEATKRLLYLNLNGR